MLNKGKLDTIVFAKKKSAEVEVMGGVLVLPGTVNFLRKLGGDTAWAPRLTQTDGVCVCVCVIQHHVMSYSV